VLPEFLVSVSDIATPVTLVLDDVHYLAGKPTRSVVKSLVDALPEGSRIALVGRSLKGLPLPLWREQGRLAEVGRKELAFGSFETRAALEQFSGGPVAEALVARVQTASEGWPAAVFLMSQTGHAGNDIDSIDEFIEAEVLDPLPADLHDFVIATAALGTVSDDLATAVTGQSRAGHFLAQAIDTVLLQRTDDHWYHYHPLLQDCAIGWLKREHPDRLRSVRAQAAGWYLEHGHPDLAVEFALTSGEPATMGRVCWPAARSSLLQGRTATVKSWMDRAGETTVLSSPELSMAAAWANMADSDFGKVLHYATATLEHLPNDWQENLGDHPVGPHLATLIATTGRGTNGYQQAAALAAAALAATPVDDPIRALTELILGLNLAFAGDPRALESVERAAAVAQANGVPSTQVESLAMRGLILLGNRRDTEGCEAIEEAQRAFAFNHLSDMKSTSGVLAIGLVALSAFRGSASDTRTAITALDTTRSRLEPLLPWYRPMAGAVCALASIRRGDVDAYRRFIAECELRAEEPLSLCRLWAERAEGEYAASSPLQKLSPAEMRVWGLLRGRMTLSEIGDSLFLSRETVKSHTVSIYRKLGVSSRREAQDLADSWS
jgi:LuxR family maltose regulon positive regulatory protein